MGPVQEGLGAEAQGPEVIRVVVAKVGLDGHDRGAKVIARGLRDAGMEVIYTGLRRTPDELAEIVLQEDADVLGLSILSGAVYPLCAGVMEALEQRGLDDVVVVVGGIVSSPQLQERLRSIGIEGCFGPGTALPDVARLTRQQVAARRGDAGF